MFLTTDGGRTWVPDPDLSFQGEDKWAGVVRFTSERNGFVFVDGKRRSLLSTNDNGAHWRRQDLPAPVYDCQAFEGDLLCSAGKWRSGFRLLTVHPQ